MRALIDRIDLATTRAALATAGYLALATFLIFSLPLLADAASPSPTGTFAGASLPGQS